MHRKIANRVKIQLDSRSVNEAFSRAALAAFLSPLDPDFGELCPLYEACGLPCDLRCKFSLAILAHTFVGIGKSIRCFISNIAAFATALPHGRCSSTTRISLLGPTKHR